MLSGNSMFRATLLLKGQREYDLAVVAVVVGDKGFDEHAGKVGRGELHLGADAIQGGALFCRQAHGYCCFFSHAGIEAHCGA